MKRQSAWRTANFRPVGDDPALMITGRSPPYGPGLLKTPRSWKNLPSKSNGSDSFHIRLRSCVHSSVYA